MDDPRSVRMPISLSMNGIAVNRAIPIPINAMDIGMKGFGSFILHIQTFWKIERSDKSLPVFSSDLSPPEFCNGFNLL